MPRATYLATPLQILQSPGNFAIVYQENHAFRVFHPDTRPHFDNTDWWMGDTRYRWEGDTLVADVVAQTDQRGSIRPATSTAPTFTSSSAIA